MIPGAAAIMTTRPLLSYGGTRDPDDLAAYSALTGERYEKSLSPRTSTPPWRRRFGRVGSYRLAHLG